MLKTVLKIGTAIAMIATSAFADNYFAQKGLKAIEFLPGWRTERGTHMAAVRIRLEQGWKTYWHTPGGNGIPPTFKWKGSQNIKSVQYHWPAPKVFIQDGIKTIGYKDELLLPIEFKPQKSGQTIQIKTRIEFGICSDVCIPISSRLQGNLDVGQKSNQSDIKAALANRPHTAKSGGIKSVSCKIDPSEDGLKITANISFRNNASDIQHTVIGFPSPNIWVEQAKTSKSGNTLQAQAELISFSNDPFILDRSKLRLTLIGKSGAIEINGCPAPT